MQLMLKEMRSVVKCLVSSILLLITATALAQEPEYIDYNDYYWGCGKTIKEAIEDLELNVNDVVTVATKTRLTNNNGKYDYKSTTGTEAFFNFEKSGIIIIPMEGYYRAGIEKSRVQHVEGQWVEEHNVYVEYPHQYTKVTGNGVVKKDTRKIITREEAKRTPSGNRSITSSVSEASTVHDEWDGRHGASWEIPEKGGGARAAIGIGLLAVLAIFLI